MGEEQTESDEIDMALRGLLRDKLDRFSGQEGENYWENIGQVYYYPSERRAEIYPAGVRVDISPVEEAIASKPDRVIGYAQTSLFEITKIVYEYPLGNPAKVSFEPHTKIIRMWAD